MAAMPTDELEGLAADGKTLRGSRKQGAIDVHLLSIVSHRLGLTLKQQAVPDKTNEIPVLKSNGEATLPPYGLVTFRIEF